MLNYLVASLEKTQLFGVQQSFPIGIYQFQSMLISVDFQKTLKFNILHKQGTITLGPLLKLSSWLVFGTSE